MSPLRFLGFGLFITVMWSLSSAYIYRRLTNRSPRARTAARALAVFVALIVPAPFSRGCSRSPGAIGHRYLGFATMGCVAKASAPF